MTMYLQRSAPIQRRTSFGKSDVSWRLIRRERSPRARSAEPDDAAGGILRRRPGAGLRKCTSARADGSSEGGEGKGGEGAIILLPARLFL